MPAAPKNAWTIPLADGPVAPLADRVAATVVASAGISLVVLLARVTPDARGHGTHEQLGMDVCGWPMVYGVPCPTCGCTTAAAQVVHGDLIGAFATQPFGAAVAVVGMLLALHALLCLVRRRSFADVLVRLPFWKLVFSGFLLMLGSWGYKYLVWSG